ncbi:anti sigma factor C-terminal domain-containing protein [Fusibacter ferrireducens]|uniref:Anti sigma factor C-terminal domain-containing protein n=1 Tax=Fusibacter ferrireducens TaxID=2785058 RepID=A0ABR9ZWB6_9FIRM|nr:anti sigma factor C-terminal domain-containing protein [Fusibacter ferrireducens]MBF4694739.1 anti sigma factor C-terminal domain-containing protein [Fusibacter ferrireducens]
MNFNALFIKYKSGTATDAEIEIVEAEIEKNKIINDYLAESLDDLFLEEHTDSLEIKEQVSNRLRKNILYSVISIILLYVFLNFAISPLVDSMYYNPKKVTQGENMNDITFDMVALTELTVPGYQSTMALVNKKGYGSYDIILRRTNEFGRNEERIPIQLTRNRREGFFDYLFSYDLETKLIEEAPLQFDYENPLKDLKSEHNYASVFITFNNPLSLLEATSYELTYNQLIFQWMSIEHGTEYQNEKIGFQPINSIRTSFGDRPNKALYPLFYLEDMYSNGEKMSSSFEKSLADNYEIHVKTLLNYMIDRKAFVTVFDRNHMRTKFYEDTLSYIDENGIKVEGMLIYGETNDLVKFIEKADVYGIQIVDMKASQYSRK